MAFRFQTAIPCGQTSPAALPPYNTIFHKEHFQHLSSYCTCRAKENKIKLCRKAQTGDLASLELFSFSPSRKLDYFSGGKKETEKNWQVCLRRDRGMLILTSKFDLQARSSRHGFFLCLELLAYSTAETLFLQRKWRKCVILEMLEPLFWLPCSRKKWKHLSSKRTVGWICVKGGSSEMSSCCQLLV